MRLKPFPGGNKLLRSDGEWCDPPTGGGEPPTWESITGKPATFPPEAHGDHVTQAALDAKAPLASPTFTGTVSGVTKTMVGLSNVDNTTDAGKPVSTATQTALDGKSASGHNHDGTYATAGHNHAGTYEPANANIQAHVAAAHAPSNAQKNSDITKAEIEAKLAGEIASHTHAGGGGGPAVKSGIVNLGAGGTALVTFGTPFGVGVTPHVVVTSQFNGSDTSTTLFAHTVTNVGFTMKGAGNAAGNVAWIATNGGNA